MTHIYAPANPISEERLKQLFDRLMELRAQKRELSQQIDMLLEEMGERRLARPEWECLRCDYKWFGYAADRPPRGCPRCHSTGWNIPPQTANSRRPGDPPAPSWDPNRKGKKPNPRKIRTPRPMPIIAPPKWVDSLPDEMRDSILTPLRPPRMEESRVDPVVVKFDDPAEPLIELVIDDGLVAPDAT